MIDGCGLIRTFLKVMIPNVIPALLTVAVFSVVWYYNDYIMSGMLLHENFPLSVNVTAVSVRLGDKLQGLTGVRRGYEAAERFHSVRGLSDRGPPPDCPVCTGTAVLYRKHRAHRYCGITPDRPPERPGAVCTNQNIKEME